MNEDVSTWHLQTTMGIPYRLYEGYPTGDFGEEDGTIVEKYIIRASDLMDFVEESFSDMTVFPGIAWFYRPARSYPSLGLGYLVTKRVSFEPFPSGKPADPISVDAAPLSADTYAQFLLLTITYSAGKSEEDTDQDIVELSVNASGEYITYFPKRSQWEDDLLWLGGVDKKLTSPLVPTSKVVPGLEWNLKFRRIPRASMGSSLLLARSLLGKVNDAAMPVIFNAPAETILFAGFSMATKWTWRNKEPFFELDLKLLEKIINEGGQIKGHNHTFNPNTGNWDRLVKTDSEGTPLDPPSYTYELGNLNQLFYTT